MTYFAVLLLRPCIKRLENFAQLIVFQIHGDPPACYGEHWIHPNYFTDISMNVLKISGSIDGYYSHSSQRLIKHRKN